MKKKFRTCILALTLVCVFATEAFANYWSSPSWYTPSSATVYISPTSIQMRNMKWDSNNFSLVHHWEGEIRGEYTAPEDEEYAVSYAWDSLESLVSNLPTYHPERDSDDISVVSTEPYKIIPGNSYYANFTMTEGLDYENGLTGGSRGWNLIFESEYGIGLPEGDAKPLGYEAYPTRLNTVSRPSISYNY